jgi:hypothetical protein
MKRLVLLLLLLPLGSTQAQNRAWEKNFDFVDDCICGLSKVKKDGKVGYVDKDGKVVINLEYTDGLTFNLGIVAVRNKDYKWQYLDSTGKAITAPLFEDAMSFEDSAALVFKDGQYGYINTVGELFIPFQYKNARSFSEGLAPATNAKGFWGYIDKKGNWIIKPQYDFADNFAGKEARVMKGEKMFYINRENTVLHE